MKSNSKNNYGVKSTKLSDVPEGEKLQFFLDYYLGKIVAITFLTIFLIYTIYSVLKPQPNYLLNVALFDESLNSDVVLEKEAEVLNLFNVEDDNSKVSLDSSFFTKNKGLDKLQVYSATGTLDVVIAQEEVFQTLAQNGYFVEVEDLVGDNEGFYSNGYKDIKDGFGAGQGDVKCYGAYIGDSEFYKSLGGQHEDAVVGILANATNTENAEIFFKYLLDN